MGTVSYFYNSETGQYDLTEPEKEQDPVNHPSHYTTGKIEVIDFIEDQKLDFHLANAVKYIARAGKKDPGKTKEDLEKAVWYINRYITHVIGGGDGAGQAQTE